MKNKKTGSNAPNCRGILRISFALQRSRGFGLIGWIIAIPLVIVALLIIIIAFYEGRKTYWDSKVKEMCANDGGVHIFEKTTITAAIAEKLPKVERSIAIPYQAHAGVATPLYYTMSEKILKEWQPKVVRHEKIVSRQIDKKVVGTIIQYSRIGGDFPTGFSEGSSFSCPGNKKIFDEQEQFFAIAD